MAESSLPRDTAEQVARGNLLYAEQQRKIRRFRMYVALSWGVLLLLLLLVFSGQSLFGFQTIQLDMEFFRINFIFIARGIPETLKVSAASIILAMILALLAALVLAPRAVSEPSGVLTPEHTRHDFGAVGMSDGLLLARFPLAVQGAPLVSSLTST